MSEKFQVEDDINYLSNPKNPWKKRKKHKLYSVLKAQAYLCAPFTPPRA